MTKSIFYYKQTTNEENYLNSLKKFISINFPEVQDPIIMDFLKLNEIEINTYLKEKKYLHFEGDVSVVNVSEFINHILFKVKHIYKENNFINDIEFYLNKYDIDLNKKQELIDIIFDNVDNETIYCNEEFIYFFTKKINIEYLVIKLFVPNVFNKSIQ